MILKDDLSAMKRVMRRLGILDKHDIVQDKGRVAGEISSGDELIITELLLSGFFNSLSSKEIAAILTIFIHDESGGSGADNSKVHIKDANLARAYTDVVKQAQKMYEIYVDCKLNIDKDTYLNGFKP
jgi:ATP-dependent RNA helicase DOB1